jgi:protein transport protein SEC24
MLSDTSSRGYPNVQSPMKDESEGQRYDGYSSSMGNGSARGYPPPPPPPLMHTNNSYPPPPQPPPQPSQYNPPHHSRAPPPRPHYEKPILDPTQIPRPPLFTRPQPETHDVPVYYPRQAVLNTNAPALPPPPADSRYTVVDDGNASPDFIRASVYAVPLHRGQWHSTGDVPLGAVCTPLAAPSTDYVPRPRTTVPNDGDNDATQAWSDPQTVPVIGQSTFHGEPPPRCTHCHAYPSPFFGTDGTCNLCGTRTRALAGPRANLPHWRCGTVEYDVGGPYVTRRAGPVQAVSLYAIDVTSPDAVDYAPILQRVGCDMAEHWNRQRHFGLGSSTTTTSPPPPPRIGIILVSACGLRLRLDAHRIVVVADVREEPFAPLPLADWTFDVSHDLDAWQEYCLRELGPDIAEWRQATARHQTSGGDGGGGGTVNSFDVSCGGAALAFLSDALAETGGRGTWMGWRRPNYGVGSLPNRGGGGGGRNGGEDATAYTPLQLLTDLKSQGEQDAATFYKELGATCIKNRVSLDVIMLHTRAPPQSGLELATLGELCQATSGKLTWIKGCDDFREALYQELTRRVQSFTGWDAVFKVRCSDGLQVKSFYSCGGNQIETLSGGSSELELSMVTTNTCIAVELEHRVGGIPKDRGLVFIQTALLYSTQSGKRRVRVSTLALRTTSIVSDTFRSADFAVVTSLLTRAAAECFRTVPSESDRLNLRSRARDLVYHRCIQILASYRQHTPAVNSPMGQLILPDRMQLLPLFCMCLLKSPMLRSSVPSVAHSVGSPTPDERAYYMWHAGQVLPAFAMLLVHPNVFSVGALDESSPVGQWEGPDEGENVNGFVRMPPTVGPSMESLEDDGVYLIDDGFRIFQYFGRLASESIKHALLSDEPSELKHRIHNLICQMRVYASITRGDESELRPTYAPIRTVLQEHGHQSPKEAEVLNLMVADATATEKDYVDFLCTLHRRIREKVESGKN